MLNSIIVRTALCMMRRNCISRLSGNGCWRNRAAHSGISENVVEHFWGLKFKLLAFFQKHVMVNRAIKIITPTSGMRLFHAPVAFNAVLKKTADSFALPTVIMAVRTPSLCPSKGLSTSGRSKIVFYRFFNSSNTLNTYRSARTLLWQ